MKNFTMFLSENTFKRMNKSRMRWYGHVACIEEKMYVHRVLMGKPQGKNPLGRPRR
jgi:hypothetical protein